MNGSRPAVKPPMVLAAQVLLLALSLAGLVAFVVLRDRLTAYGQGRLLVGPWLFVWGCALLALTYDGRARNGVRLTTVVLMVLFVVLPALSEMFKAGVPLEFALAAVRFVLGLPVVVLLCLRESLAWFDRAR